MFFYYALVDISDEGMTEATTPTLRTSRGGTKQEKPIFSYAYFAQT